MECLFKCYHPKERGEWRIIEATLLNKLIDGYAEDGKLSLESLNDLINDLVELSIEVEFGSMSEFERYIQETYLEGDV